MEIWKNIEETGDLYSVSNKGVVKRNKDGKIMKQYLHPISLPVIQYDFKGKLLNKYPSIIEASRQVGCCDSGISKACRGIYRQYKGYKWRYANL